MADKDTVARAILEGLNNAVGYARSGRGAVRVHEVNVPDEIDVRRKPYSARSQAEPTCSALRPK